MAGLNKVVTSYDEALAGLTDGMTLIAGGFGLCRIPEGLIAQIKNGYTPTHRGFQQLRRRWIWPGHIA